VQLSLSSSLAYDFVLQLTVFVSQGLFSCNVAHSVFALTVTKRHVAATDVPQFSFKKRFRRSLPDASVIALADILLDFVMLVFYVKSKFLSLPRNTPKTKN